MRLNSSIAALIPDHAPPGIVHRPELLGWIALLPDVLTGFCLGAWVLTIALEWLDEAFFWQSTCTSHDEQILQAAWHWWQGSAGASIWLVEDLVSVSNALQEGSATLITSLGGRSGLFWTKAVTKVIRCTLLSTGSVTLTFLLRLVILLQVLPLFALVIIAGLIDGLVGRDLRRLGAGHESGSVYYHTRRVIGSNLTGTGLVWLTVPVFLEPECIVIPGVMLIDLAGSVATGAFKRHL